MVSAPLTVLVRSRNMRRHRIERALNPLNMLRAIIAGAIVAGLGHAIWPPLSVLGLIAGLLLYAGLIFADG